MTNKADTATAEGGDWEYLTNLSIAIAIAEARQTGLEAALLWAEWQKEQIITVECEGGDHEYLTDLSSSTGVDINGLVEAFLEGASEIVDAHNALVWAQREVAILAVLATDPSEFAREYEVMVAKHGPTTYSAHGHWGTPAIGGGLSVDGRVEAEDTLDADTAEAIDAIQRGDI